MMQTTSTAAQLSLSLEGKETQRKRILEHLRLMDWFGATDEQLQTALRMEGSTERPRRGELVAMGLVEDSLERRKTKANRMAIVWRVRR